MQHRFSRDTPIDGRNSFINGSTKFLHQIKNVLRFKEGETIIIFDNSGFDFKVRIEKYEKDGVLLKIIDKVKNTNTPFRETWLFSSIVKKDNFEWIVEKATELGVSKIFPIVSKRSEKKNLNFGRLEKIVIEASEQSGRATLPIVSVIMDFDQAVNLVKSEEEVMGIAFHTKGETFDRSMLTIDSIKNKVVAVFIGPEGGWTDREMEVFKNNAINSYRLGPQILRAETAVVAALSQIVF